MPIAEPNPGFRTGSQNGEKGLARRPRRRRDSARPGKVPGARTKRLPGAVAGGPAADGGSDAVPYRCGRMYRSGKRQLGGQPLGVRQVGAAQAAGDELGPAGIGSCCRTVVAIRNRSRFLVARVVVQVPGEPQAHGGAGCLEGPGTPVEAAAEVVLLKEMHLAERIGVVGALHPVRGGHAQDDGIARKQPCGHRVVEVVQLRFVDVLAQLAVQPHEPPPGRIVAAGEPKGKVAARLDGPPPADVPLPGEQPDEGCQAVVPVMVAGEGQHNAVAAGGVAARQRRPVGPHHAVLVGGGRRHRVHLVAAEHQDPAAAQLVSLHGERLFGQQRGHRVGGIEAVAQVSREVEPKISVSSGDSGDSGPSEVPDHGLRGLAGHGQFFQIKLVARKAALEFAFVAEVGKDGRQDNPHRSPAQLGRSQPAHGVPGSET